MHRQPKLIPLFKINHGLGLAVVVFNDQPKKEYEQASWYFGILILCFTFSLNLKYNYKNPQMKKQLIESLDKTKLLQALSALEPDKNYSKLNQTLLRQKIAVYSYKAIVKALNY